MLDFAMRAQGLDGGLKVSSGDIGAHFLKFFQLRVEFADQLHHVCVPIHFIVLRQATKDFARVRSALTPTNPAFGHAEAAILPMNAPISSNIGDVAGCYRIFIASFTRMFLLSCLWAACEISLSFPMSSVIGVFTYI
ncbi:MAG: hypothetical protein J7530_14375 [Novosphingobium sp.]|nr:hypothetical protein [Novosphingobium sp.]